MLQVPPTEAAPDADLQSATQVGVLRLLYQGSRPIREAKMKVIKLYVHDTAHHVRPAGGWLLSRIHPRDFYTWTQTNLIDRSSLADFFFHFSTGKHFPKISGPAVISGRPAFINTTSRGWTGGSGDYVLALGGEGPWSFTVSI